MLGRFLKNWAGTGWKVISDRVHSYSDFREKFIAQYWNIQIQRRVRYHLEFGNYHPSMNMTTTHYVLNVMAQVKHLTPPIEERDLVQKLARHFSERTRVATTTRGVDTLEKFIMVVDECQDLERDLQRVNNQLSNYCLLYTSRCV